MSEWQREWRWESFYVWIHETIKRLSLYKISSNLHNFRLFSLVFNGTHVKRLSRLTESDSRRSTISFNKSSILTAIQRLSLMEIWKNWKQIDGSLGRRQIALEICSISKYMLNKCLKLSFIILVKVYTWCTYWYYIVIWMNDFPYLFLSRSSFLWKDLNILIIQQIEQSLALDSQHIHFHTIVLKSQRKFWQLQYGKLMHKTKLNELSIFSNP